MGRRRRKPSWWKRHGDPCRRGFLQFMLTTWGAAFGWGLSRYFPAPAPVAFAPPVACPPSSKIVGGTLLLTWNVVRPEPINLSDSVTVTIGPEPTA